MTKRIPWLVPSLAVASLTWAWSRSAEAAITYSTKFDLTESPISEGGAWRTGVDPLQSAVRTSGGVAFGTQTGDETSFNDSDAFLSGFPPDQAISGVVHRVGTPNGDLELELLLRWSVGPLRTELPFGDTHSYGYEVNVGVGEFGSFLQIGLFKSTNLYQGDLSVQDGDVVSAEVTGNTITVKLNGSIAARATDPSAAFPTGNPGIGFYRATNGAPDDPSTFAWTSVTATATTATIAATSVPVPRGVSGLGGGAMFGLGILVLSVRRPRSASGPRRK